MPTLEPDGERLPRVWTGAVLVQAWQAAWGAVAVASLVQWVNAGGWVNGRA